MSKTYDIKVPTCPVARTLALKPRLAHYRACPDERCKARAAAAALLARSIAASLLARSRPLPV